MTDKPKIFWMRGSEMKKFHAFTLWSDMSLCGRWFCGGRASVEDWDKSNDESSKCSYCKSRVKDMEREKVVFT